MKISARIKEYAGFLAVRLALGFSLALALTLFENGVGFAGVHLGLTGAIKSQVKKLDDKVKTAEPAMSVLTVTGNVVKGPVIGATITFYALNSDGTKGRVLGRTTSSATGTFSIPITVGTSQPFLAEATGGYYVNEVTGSSETLTSSDVLSAVLSAGTTVAALTPVTSMAAALARALALAGTPLAAAIDSANRGVARQYNLLDIIGTLPVAVNSSTPVATSSLSQRNYGLLLAAIAQEAATLNVRPIDLAAALALDMTDGILDGKNGSTIITIPTITGGTVVLPPGAGTSGLQAALNAFLISTNNLSNLSTVEISTTARKIGATPSSPLYITTAALPYWIEGQLGSAPIQASGGVAPYACALPSGSALPAGWSLVNCTITGLAPLLTGGSTMRISPPFTIVVADAGGHSVTAEFRITTIKADPTFVLAPPGTCAKGEACTIGLIASASGGTPPYYYGSDTFADGPPPLGMIVDLKGNLTGTPLLEGIQPFRVCIVDLVGLTSCQTASVTITAATGKFDLAVTDAGSGSGAVTSSPSGISCGSTCSGSFAAGSTVTLTAMPITGSAFVGWSGACSGTDDCTVTMSADQAVTATFGVPYTGPFTGTEAITEEFSDIDTNGVGPATCNWTLSLSGDITLTLVQKNDGTVTGTAKTTGSLSYPTGSSSNPLFTCLPGTLSIDSSVSASGTISNIQWTSFLWDKRDTDAATASLSGNTVTGSTTMNINATDIQGSGSLQFTLTK